MTRSFVKMLPVVQHKLTRLRAFMHLQTPGIRQYASMHSFDAHAGKRTFSCGIAGPLLVVDSPFPAASSPALPAF